jgi:uracil-DNA glycosylase family 4
MLTARQQHCLKGIGIQQWVKRSETSPAPETVDALEIIETAAKQIVQRVTPEIPAVKIPSPAKLDSWDDITHSIHQCEACELSANCTQKVPGVGSQQAEVMIIGEGPGHEEDLKGEPFVGRSGQLLDKMLLAIGLSRSQVFITNIVKCRPPNNRDPHVDEVKACGLFLQAQIKLIAPRVILSVGRISAHHLLNSTSPVGKLIDQIHSLPDSDIPLKVTYHPAYLLRNPSAKSIAWKDMKILHRMLKK